MKTKYIGKELIPITNNDENIKNKTNYIMFVIHPTDFEDFDVLALGNLGDLKKLKRKNKYFTLIKSSKYGEIPVLILDTARTVSMAKKILIQLKNDFLRTNKKSL